MKKLCADLVPFLFIIVLPIMCLAWMGYLIYEYGVEAGKVEGRREREAQYQKLASDYARDYGKCQDELSKLKQELKFWKTVMPLAKD
jgi:hypothetical protein